MREREDGTGCGAIVCLLLGVSGGCGGGGSDQEQVNTETDGVVTTGVSDEGADETAEQPPYFCIYNEDNPGYVGVKHQCSLEYDLDISFTVTPPVGPSFVVPMSLSGVQTLNDSTYEHPFVMACCSNVTEHPDWPFADSCGYEHHRACTRRAVQPRCDHRWHWVQRPGHQRHADQVPCRKWRRGSVPHGRGLVPGEPFLHH